MAWTELRPVKRGDLFCIEVDGVAKYYRARRAVRDIGDLRLRDLQHDPAIDENAAMRDDADGS